MPGLIRDIKRCLESITKWLMDSVFVEMNKKEVGLVHELGQPLIKINVLKSIE
jgi:hypothetical protein